MKIRKFLMVIKGTMQTATKTAAAILKDSTKRDHSLIVVSESLCRDVLILIGRNLGRRNDGLHGRWKFLKIARASTKRDWWICLLTCHVVLALFIFSGCARSSIAVVEHKNGNKKKPSHSFYSRHQRVSSNRFSRLYLISFNVNSRRRLLSKLSYLTRWLCVRVWQFTALAMFTLEEA